jgi:hypothetical protein
MLASRRAAILMAIKAREKSLLDEQRRYCAVTRSALSAPATNLQFQQLATLGWEGVHHHMVGERFPPTSQDWKERAGLEWDQTPKYLQLQAIEDSPIRTATYFCSELADQTLRFKAAARYFSLFGASNRQISTCFGNWQILAMRVEIASMHTGGIT